MKRLSIVIAASLALVLILLGSTALGHRHGPYFAARASHAEQGAVMYVGARVIGGRPHVPFSASAIVHFAEGDVTVDLVRHRRPLTAWGRVAVAADAAVGPVPVDVTIHYGRLTVVLSVEGVIEPGEGEEPPPPA